MLGPRHVIASRFWLILIVLGRSHDDRISAKYLRLQNDIGSHFSHFLPKMGGVFGVIFFCM